MSDKLSKSIIDLMQKHISIRKYKPTTIPEDHINKAIEAGQNASTSHNVQAYSVIQITDTLKRKKIVALSGNQEKVLYSGAFLLFCGDLRRHKLICEENGIKYSGKFEAFLVSIIDTALMSQNVALALESMRYGICYIGGIRNKLRELKDLLNLPKGVLPLFGMTVGVPDEKPWIRPRLPRDCVFFKDRYPDDEELVKIIKVYDKEMANYYAKRGATSRSWIPVMTEKFASARRPEISEFYKSQGASLD